MDLKKIGKLFTSKFVGTGPSSYEKKNLPDRGLTKFQKHWSRAHLNEDKDEPISLVIPVAFDLQKYGKSLLCHKCRVTRVGMLWLPIKRDECWLLS